MISVVRKVGLAALVAAFATPILAATYIVPSDAEMIQKSDDIVVGTAVASTVERDARGAIVTRYTLRVEESLKGDLAPHALLTLTEPGGALGGTARMIAGAPEYEPGVRYLVFTSTNRDLEPVTFGMALGQFRIVEKNTRTLAVRLAIHGYDQNFAEYEERARDAELFTAFIRDTVAQRGSKIDYFVPDARERQISVEAEIAPNAFSATSYLMQSGGVGFRWQTPAASWVRAGTQPGPGDGPTAVAVAFSEWNGAGANINYADTGVDSTATGGLISDDGKNAILFGDPNNEIDETTGVAGRGGISLAFSGNIDGTPYFLADEADVVMSAMSLSQSCMNGVMTHEVGHTLGFRHSNQPPTSGGESTTSAIMNSSVSCGLNGVLQTYDITAAQTVYGTGVPVCNAPAITAQPQDKSISLGASTTLSVGVSGTAPMTFAWFTGPVGNTSTQVGSASSISVSPAATTTYWVRVSNACPGSPANSTLATVTVTCDPPAITGQPQNVTITGGQSTTLQVTAAGSSLTFQWFRGEVGDRSDPLGTSSNRLTVTPSETTKYWVHITGPCGPAVDSQAVTVTVIPCAEIVVNPPTATPGTGAGKYTLNITASSTAPPLTFGWFRGGTPGFGGTAIGSGQSVSVTVTAATVFWARIQNGCGRVEFSAPITLAPCTLPTITTQPQDQTINSGANASLSIAFTSGDTVAWYRGTLGDKTNLAGTGASISVGPLTATTKFWAEVTKNGCGAVSSREVTVTVRQLAELVPMLGGRFFVQVAYKNQFDNGKTGKLLGRSLFSTALSETAVFTFGDQNVIELLVRVSDARPFDNHIHIFLGGLSDVEFSIVVTDTLTGIIHEYKKPPNQLVGTIDRATFPASSSLLPQPVALKIAPSAESSTIRLLNNRFEVRMHYRNQFTNPAGEGYMNARSIASSPTTETAVFFFDENVGSAEWMVRFSDARPFANRIDMFHGGLSDVEFTIEVLDTKTGQRKEYQKPPFSLSGQVDRDSYLP